MSIISIDEAIKRGRLGSIDRDLVAYDIEDVQETIRNIANCDYWDHDVNAHVNCSFIPEVIDEQEQQNSVNGKIVANQVDFDFTKLEFQVGQTIEVLGSYNNNRLFTIKAITALEIEVDSIELLQEVHAEQDRNVFITKICWPNGIKSTAVKMIRFNNTSGLAAGLKSKSVSRVRVSYNNGASDLRNGYPKDVVGQIEMQLPESRWRHRYSAYEFFCRYFSYELDPVYFGIPASHYGY